MARPANSAGTSVAEITWLGTMSASWSNHHSESRVRILPLSGIGVGQHHVVDRHPVGGDQDQIVPVGVDVADLAGVQQLHADHPRSHAPAALEGAAQRDLVGVLQVAADGQPAGQPGHRAGPSA